MHKLARSRQIKNIFQIQKFFFRMKEDHTTSLDNTSERKKKKNNLYCPKQELIFKNGILPLINTKNSIYLKGLKTQSWFFIGVSLSAASVSLGTVAMGSYLFATVAGGVSALFFRYNYNLNVGLSRVVTEFNLQENGKSVQIVTVKKKFDVNIKFLAKPNKIQAHALKTFNPKAARMAIPFVIDKGQHRGFYYIAPDATFENKEEIISAIMNNSYIEVFSKIGSRNKVLE